MFCREQAVQLHRERAGIEKRGARLAFVGNGNRHFARGFRDQFGITADVYVDTTRASYGALGFRRAGLGPRAMLTTARAGVRALRAGFSQGRVQGDALQLGGVLAVDPGGIVRYRYVSGAAGDHPATADVLAALGD